MKIIFEIANNHMGDVAHGERLLKILGEISNQYPFEFCVKFQFRDLATLIHGDHKGSNLKYIKRFEETELTDEAWGLLFNAARASGLETMVTPFDEPSVSKLIRYGADELKIASCSLGDWPLFEEIAAKWNGPITMSTGGATLGDIDNAVSFWCNRKFDLSLMHCVALYPTPSDNLDLGQIKFLKERYPNLTIGYSTHEDPGDFLAGPIAVALGAEVLEKHVGLSTGDYAVNNYSAEPNQLCSWLDALADAKSRIGESARRRHIAPEEASSITSLARGAYAAKNLTANQTVSTSDVYFAMPATETALTAKDFSKYSEVTLMEDVAADSPVLSQAVLQKMTHARVRQCHDKIAEIVRKSGVTVPLGATLEISHHYGVDRFEDYGLGMITVVNEEYCKKILIVTPGQKHPPQYHKNKTETFHLIWGSLRLTLDGATQEMAVGQVVTIAPGTVHEFESLDGCVIEEISTNHSSEDSFYLNSSIANNRARKTLVSLDLE